ncbi:MAG: hypothetical protein P0S94_04035 [Simkaniaceae bacterium]|nr:hypothetical protein [Simkaniaceae bacterium]
MAGVLEAGMGHLVNIAARFNIDKDNAGKMHRRSIGVDTDSSVIWLVGGEENGKVDEKIFGRLHTLVSIICKLSITLIAMPYIAVYGLAFVFPWSVALWTSAALAGVGSHLVVDQLEKRVGLTTFATGNMIHKLAGKTPDLAESVIISKPAVPLESASTAWKIVNWLNPLAYVTS